MSSENVPVYNRPPSEDGVLADEHAQVPMDIAPDELEAYFDSRKPKDLEPTIQRLIEIEQQAKEAQHENEIPHDESFDSNPGQGLGES
ncbi:hypothetical protein AAVH_42527, partial [Aphelenchoides avenae]